MASTLVDLSDMHTKLLEFLNVFSGVSAGIYFRLVSSHRLIHLNILVLINCPLEPFNFKLLQRAITVRFV